MIDIRPISDLRSKFSEIENEVQQGKPIYLTKNGYGTMVVMSLEHYSKLTDDIEMKLDAADAMAESPERLTHASVFGKAKELIAKS